MAFTITISGLTCQHKPLSHFSTMQFIIMWENVLCVVDAATDVGRSIARIFTGFLSREFGEETFKVERVGDAHPVSPELKATGTA